MKEDNVVQVNIDDFPETEFLTTVLVKALVQILRPDEGIVIHHGNEAYIVYYNSATSELKVIEDEEYLEIEHGRLIWMHYEGSTAPDPAFNEEVFCDPDSDTKH